MNSFIVNIDLSEPSVKIYFSTHGFFCVIEISSGTDGAGDVDGRISSSCHSWYERCHRYSASERRVRCRCVPAIERYGTVLFHKKWYGFGEIFSEETNQDFSSLLRHHSGGIFLFW